MRGSGSDNLSRANDSTIFDASVKNKNDEEREGLLSGVQDPERELDLPEHHGLGLSWSHRPWSGSRLAALAAACIFFLIGVVFARTFLLIDPTDHFASKNVQDVTSNGTHDFRKTVLIVSIDGLRCELTLCSVFDPKLIVDARADYLDRGLTPHLLDISKQGLRAKFMRPVFPVCFIQSSKHDTH
jgi:Type I phosphodiesterase / nucleotide pyrophosphatase